ncbi:hypothetical protein NCC78_00350 [Micromonospora phytophila]|uniref:hypothetical protein n=1 Tax=Micromonospora phytophila TaxID=709888 RepID=UPI00202E0365|nr:hypothetical protein [Micromonospora phytophila]MCM0673187.1 hypothetical protein [Micromonospora phytophila]
MATEVTLACGLMDDRPVERDAGLLRDALKALFEDEVPVRPGAMAIVAASPVTTPEHREVLARVLRGSVADLLRQRGPVAWRPQDVAQVCAATGLTRAESALLLAGLPLRDWDDDDFLSEAQLAVLGLTAREATIARMELMTVPVEHRVRVLDAAMPNEPAVLWENGPLVGRLCATWIALQGHRIPVPEQLLADLGTVMGFPTGILRVFGAPRPGDWLHTDGRCRIEAGAVLTEAADGGEPFSDRHLPSAATGLAWLAYHLPAGDPIRANLASVYQLIRDRLRNPDLLIGTVLLRDDAVPTPLPPGVMVGASYQSGLTSYHLRPAAIADPDDPALNVVPDHSPISVRLMLDPAFERMIRTLETSGLPAGAYSQNALLSAPDTVERIAARFGLNRPEASLYLQVLALPDPTEQNLLRWNGWDDRQLADLGSTLLAKRLLVESETPGRRLAVPGPWLSPRFVPPFEAWKSALYGVGPGEEPLYRWVLVTRPLTDLFHDAASRVIIEFPHPAR